MALRQSTGLSLAQVTARPVCPRAPAGHATCAAQTLVLRSTGAPVRPRVAAYRALGRVRPALSGSAQRSSEPAATGAPQPDSPGYLQQAYDLTYLSQSAGGSDTVAVVDAYDDPTAQTDLGTYRSTYGLPACTASTGCFQKVNEGGAASPLPGPDPNWDQEISLDLDAVSAICPLCHILLIEASSNSFADLQAAMQTAAALGAKQISASWSGTSSTVPAVFRTFSGVATVAATGDYGYTGAGEDNYPAALPGVTAAGGTSLAAASGPSARGFGEAAWAWNGLNGGGSGCAITFQRPAYQPAEGCSGRAYADISADADPDTGLAVYDNRTWSVVGGTSLSAPLIAAYYAVTGVAGSTPQWAYSAGRSLNDVVSGATGDCATAIAYICNAGPGYDGPTGMGSISGAVVAGAPGIGGPAVSSSSGAGNSYTQSVGSHDATIAGGVYRNGLDTTWWIEYGTTSAYGSQTPASDIGAGSGPVSVTGYLSQLSPGTTYHYRLVARNSLGTTYGYDYTFTTAAAPAGAPTAAFSFSPGTPAPGSPVSFDGSASAPAPGASLSDYSWNFGDGTAVLHTGTAPSATHSYATRGTYTVTLTVTSSDGQTDSSTQTVTVDNPPTAAFTPSAAAVAPGTKVSFNARASAPAAGGAITDYSWSFGDGSMVDAGTAANTSHTFNIPGTYTVTLTTTDDLDVTATVTKVITVASFTMTPTSPTPGSLVTFNAITPSALAGTVTDYVWNFGDGSPALDTGTTPTATHTFAARGPYSITLTIETSAGGTASATASSTSAATVTVDAPPTAAFSRSAATVVPGTAVSLDASASSAATGGSIADYSWNFGDGLPAQDTGSTAGAVHTYTSPGIYTITLTTTDDLGDTATATQQVTVDEPTASFISSAAVIPPGAPVAFDASGSSDPESTIVDYSWNFGDGSGVQDAGTNPGVTHPFTTPGTYTVELTATDAFGFAAVATENVTVATPAAPSPGTSGPPPASTPVASPAPAPPPGPGAPAPSALAVSLKSAGKQRLVPALAHGLRVALALNQSAAASFQVTVPLTETKRGSGPKRSSRDAKATVVLLRRAQMVGAGGHTITLKLSRAAVRQLATAGSLVVTVRVTIAGAGGGRAARTVKISLTR